MALIIMVGFHRGTGIIIRFGGVPGGPSLTCTITLTGDPTGITTITARRAGSFTHTRSTVLTEGAASSYTTGIIRRSHDTEQKIATDIAMTTDVERPLTMRDEIVPVLHLEQITIDRVRKQEHRSRRAAMII